MPACSSVLRVIIPDEYNGSLQTRTLPVRPHTTTKEVCRIIAHKARITNPQDFGLFQLVDGEGEELIDYFYLFSDVIKCRPSNYRDAADGDGLSAGGSLGGQGKALPVGLQENRRENCVANYGIRGIPLKRGRRTVFYIDGRSLPWWIIIEELSMANYLHYFSYVYLLHILLRFNTSIYMWLV